MTYLITGGAGFIGSHFISHLKVNHPEDAVVCLDKMTYASNPDVIKAFQKYSEFHFVKADICDRKAVYATFETFHPDIVVNFAAESHVDRSIEHPEIFLQTNIIGVSVLMDACRKYGIQRFHQVSTDEVYGDLPLDRTDLKFTENSPLHPSSAYSSSKASADLLVLAYHRTYRLPVTISRCSNNYGTHQHPEKLIPLMVHHALLDQPLPVYGNGLNVRDWIHVDDHCRTIEWILHKGKDGEIYNIGAGCEITNIELVKQICQILGKSEDLIRFVPDRMGHDLRYVVDSSKIRDKLGWAPMVSFESGFRETVLWYAQHK